MPKPYKKATGYGWMWILTIFAGIAIGIAIATQLPKDTGAWIFLIVCTPIMAGIIIAAIIDNRLTKARQMRIQSFLEALGLTVVRDPDPEVKQTFFAPIQHLERNAGLSGGSVNLQWIAYGAIQGRQALIFEHQFLTGSGKHTQIHDHTAVCWVGNQPWFTLIRPRIGEGRRLERSHPELHIADEVFDKNWIIWGEEAGLGLLTDSFRSLLSDSPRGEMWCFGGGWACCLCKFALDEMNLANFIQRSGNGVFV